MILYNKAEVIPANGTVNNHENPICFKNPIFKASKPRAKPTPVIEPITMWVEETGSPKTEAINTVVAAEKSTENPRELFKSVIPSPTDFITLCPQTATPIEIPIPPRTNSILGTGV